VDVIICLVAGLFSVMWFEVLKFFTHRKHHPET
jgi:hypothetical protein